MNLLDILSTSPHYFCRKWIGATNENSNFDAFLYLEWQSNRYYNSFVRHEGFQSSTRDMPAGYQRCWRTWSVDKLAGNRGNKVQGDPYKILFSTAWCIRLKWLVVAVSFFHAFLLFHPKLLYQQFAIFTCSWSRCKWTLIFTFLFVFQIGALKILKEISRNCIIRKAIADLGGEEGPRASWLFASSWRQILLTLLYQGGVFYDSPSKAVQETTDEIAVAYEQALWGALVELGGGGGKRRRACNYVSGIWIALLLPLWLPLDWAVRFLPISISQRLFRWRYSNSRDVFASSQLLPFPSPPLGVAHSSHNTLRQDSPVIRRPSRDLSKYFWRKLTW